MIRCLDIHTHHHAPQPEGVISSSVSSFSPAEYQLYSIGIHPWNSDREISVDEWHSLEKLVELTNVVAIGETGIDKLRGGSLYKQIIVFKKHVELSEKVGKPLIIHDVKAHDVIIGLKKDFKPRQNWMIHGFRGKPSLAKMLTDAGIYLSFGEKFNSDTLSSMPLNMILAETDESSLSIEDIIHNLSLSIGSDITKVILSNTNAFLSGYQESKL